MAHISLYRKYRPASFEEVVGQEHVTRTLANAIASGAVSHAYLFAGSRGTGKTSTAKLLAKALNCAEAVDGKPCGQCDSCRTISAGTSLDVIEMDAASNRGIDDIREIRDRVAFASVEGRYRVYILDEAHMLTKEASNAFLKVLEEPPAHVIFVLCTTEAHKVIPTIQSRCQKFEFRRPDAGMVLQVLQRIVDAEGIDIDEAGLAAIARSGAGAFRDAIGALDQLATYCEGRIALADVLAMLGTVESDLLFEAVDIVSENDARGALLFVDRLAARGSDFGQFAQELIGHLRNIFLTQQMEEEAAGIINLSDEDIQRLRGQARIVPPPQVLRFIELLTEANSWMKQGNNPRLQLELAFIRITQPQADTSTKSLLYRLQQLEERIERGGMPAGSASPAWPTNRAGAAKRPDVVPSRSMGGSAQSPPKAESAPASDKPAGWEAAKAVAAQESMGAQDPGEPVMAQAEEEESGEAPAVEPSIELSLDRIARAWTIILDQVKKKKIPLFSILQEGRPVELEGDTLVLGFPAGTEFHKSQAEKPENLAVLAGVLEQMTGSRLQVKCVVKEGISPVKQPPSIESDVPTTSDLIEMLKQDLGAEEI